MLPSSPSTDPAMIADDDPERGSAALEFILVGLLLLVPLVYLIVVARPDPGAVARRRGRCPPHRARAVGDGGPDAATAAARADRVLAPSSTSTDSIPARVDVSLECRPAGAACPEAGCDARRDGADAVALPLVPPVLGLDRLASIPVEALRRQKVSRFWGAG